MAHPHQSPDSGAQGPGARPKALSCRLPNLGWFSVGVRRLEEARTTGLTCRDTYPRLLTRGFEVVRPGWLAGCIMVELQRCVVSEGMVVGGRGAPSCRQSMGWRSCFDPCMPGWFGVGRLACGLFIVGSFSLQLGWYMVVLAALRSAGSSWGLSCCSPRRRSRMLSLLSSRLGRRFVAAGLSDVAVIVLRPGRAGRVLLVRCHRSRQWSACLGLVGGRYGPGRPHLVAVGPPLRCLFPVRCVLSWHVRLWRVRV